MARRPSESSLCGLIPQTWPEKCVHLKHTQTHTASHVAHREMSTCPGPSTECNTAFGYWKMPCLLTLVRLQQTGRFWQQNNTHTNITFKTRYVRTGEPQMSQDAMMWPNIKFHSVLLSITLSTWILQQDYQI